MQFLQNIFYIYTFLLSQLYYAIDIYLISDSQTLNVKGNVTFDMTFDFIYPSAIKADEYCHARVVHPFINFYFISTFTHREIEAHSQSQHWYISLRDRLSLKMGDLNLLLKVTELFVEKFC